MGPCIVSIFQYISSKMQRYTFLKFTVSEFVHPYIVLISIQTDAAFDRILFLSIYALTLHVSSASAHHQESSLIAHTAPVVCVDVCLCHCHTRQWHRQTSIQKTGAVCAVKEDS
jgi:hypothetical protein